MMSEKNVWETYEEQEMKKSFHLPRNKSASFPRIRPSRPA